MKTYTLIATAPMGIEAIVAKEVRDLGYECTVDNGKVIFKGMLLRFAVQTFGCVQQTGSRYKLLNFRQKHLMSFLNKRKRLTGPLFYQKTVRFLSSGNL